MTAQSTQDPGAQGGLFDQVRAHLELERFLGQDALPRARKAPASSAAEFLAQRAAEIADCTKCRLAEGRTQVVYGVGDPQADLMFIGEAPGRDEDIKGEPFVGRAGQLLTKIIRAMGMKRSDVYITNICKSRPPENRLPRPDEVRACLPYLEEQIAVIQPEVIVCLGRLAASVLLETDAAMGKMRGRFYEREGVKVMPTYHPAYLLRNPAAKKQVWEDMQKVMEVLGRGRD